MIRVIIDFAEKGVEGIYTIDTDLPTIPKLGDFITFCQDDGVVDAKVTRISYLLGGRNEFEAVRLWVSDEDEYLVQ